MFDFRENGRTITRNYYYYTKKKLWGKDGKSCRATAKRTLAHKSHVATQKILDLEFE